MLCKKRGAPLCHAGTSIIRGALLFKKYTTARSSYKGYRPYGPKALVRNSTYIERSRAWSIGDPKIITLHTDGNLLKKAGNERDEAEEF